LLGTSKYFSPSSSPQPKDSLIPKPGIPQTTVDAFKILVKAQDGFTVALETYLSSLDAIAASQNASDPSQPNPDIAVDYSTPKTELGKVKKASTVLAQELNKLSPQLRQKMIVELTTLNQAMLATQDRVPDPFSEASADTTGRIETSKFLNEKKTVLKKQIDVIRGGLTVPPAQPTTSPSSPSAVSTDNPIAKWADPWSVIASFLTLAGQVATIALLLKLMKSLRHQNNEHSLSSQNQGGFLNELNSEQEQRIIDGMVTELSKLGFNQSPTDTSAPSHSDSRSEGQYRQLAQVQQELTVAKQQLKSKDDEIATLQKKVEEINRNEALASPSSAQALSSGSSTPLPDAIDALAEEYGNNPGRFKQVATVSLNKESLENVQQGKTEALVLVPSSGGNYYVISGKNSPNYYLVPIKNWVLNEGTLDSLKNLYDIQAQPNTSRSKPQPTHLAVVTLADDSWKLVKRGKLEFVPQPT